MSNCSEPYVCIELSLYGSCGPLCSREEANEYLQRFLLKLCSQGWFLNKLSGHNMVLKRRPLLFRLPAQSSGRSWHPVTRESRLTTCPPGPVRCLRHGGRPRLCDEADVRRALLPAVREVWHRTAAPHKISMALLLWLFFKTRSNTKTA